MRRRRDVTWRLERERRLDSEFNLLPESFLVRAPFVVLSLKPKRVMKKMNGRKVESSLFP